MNLKKIVFILLYSEITASYIKAEVVGILPILFLNDHKCNALKLYIYLTSYFIPRMFPTSIYIKTKIAYLFSGRLPRRTALLCRLIQKPQFSSLLQQKTVLNK